MEVGDLRSKQRFRLPELDRLQVVRQPETESRLRRDAFCLKFMLVLQFFARFPHSTAHLSKLE